MKSAITLSFPSKPVCVDVFTTSPIDFANSIELPPLVPPSEAKRKGYQLLPELRACSIFDLPWMSQVSQHESA